MKRLMLKRLAARFKNKEYRDAYAASFLTTSLAAQIKALREQRGWNQKELAQRAGMTQSQVSRLENVNYDGWTIQTLLRLARVYDVALNVSFGAFSALAHRVDDFGPAALQVESFEDDKGFKRAPRSIDSTSARVLGTIIVMKSSAYEGLKPNTRSTTPAALPTGASPTGGFKWQPENHAS